MDSERDSIGSVVLQKNVREEFLQFVHPSPSPNLFGNPATSLYRRPVALRPRLTTSLPFSQRFLDEEDARALLCTMAANNRDVKG
jgi:hypothetical protein